MSTDNPAVLRPSSRFDFNSFRNFRTSYEAALKTNGVRQLIVDMRDVQYIDSAALGILLLLRDKAAEAKCTIEIHNLHGTAKDVLEIANFHKIFTIR